VALAQSLYTAPLQDPPRLESPRSDFPRGVDLPAIRRAVHLRPSGLVARALPGEVQPAGLFLPFGEPGRAAVVQDRGRFACHESVLPGNRRQAGSEVPGPRLHRPRQPGSGEDAARTSVSGAERKQTVVGGLPRRDGPARRRGYLARGHRIPAEDQGANGYPVSAVLRLNRVTASVAKVILTKS